MKVGDVVELVDEEEESIVGTIIEIVVRIEDGDGEVWEIPADEATLGDGGS